MQVLEQRKQTQDIGSQAHLLHAVGAGTTALQDKYVAPGPGWLVYESCPTSRPLSMLSPRPCLL